MTKKIQEEVPEEDTAALLKTAMTLNAPPQNYTRQDKYRDFRAVFLGNEQGQRVLHEMLGWGHMFKPSFQMAGPIDPHRMSIHEGERNYALRLLSTVTQQPTDGPAQVTRKKGES